MKPSYTCWTYAMKSSWATSRVSRRRLCSSRSRTSCNTSLGRASRFMPERYYSQTNLSNSVLHRLYRTTPRQIWGEGVIEQKLICQTASVTPEVRGTCCTHPLYMPAQLRAQSEAQSTNLFTFLGLSTAGIFASLRYPYEVASRTEAVH